MNRPAHDEGRSGGIDPDSLLRRPRVSIPIRPASNVDTHVALIVDVAFPHRAHGTESRRLGAEFKDGRFAGSVSPEHASPTSKAGVGFGYGLFIPRTMH